MTTTIRSAAGELGFSPDIARQSDAMARVLAEVDAFARDGRRVLLHGPSGAGKECLARYYALRALHHGARSGDAEFVAINCACLGSLTDSELFGHLKGSATGVTYDRRGAFERAQHGILFLDEVAELGDDIEPRLLRALDPDRGDAQRLGAEQTYDTTCVSVIAATNRPLDRLRTDMLARLGHLVEVPGLEQRTPELRPTLRVFVERALTERRDRAGTWLDAGQVASLAGTLSHRLAPIARRVAWPASFRSLRNCVEYAVSMPSLFVSLGAAAPERYAAAVVAEFEHRSGRDRAAAAQLADARVLRLRGAIEDALGPTAAGDAEPLARFLATRVRAFGRIDIDRTLAVSENTSRDRLAKLKQAGIVVSGGRNLWQLSTGWGGAGDGASDDHGLQVPAGFRVEPMAEEVAELTSLLERVHRIYINSESVAVATELVGALACSSSERPVLWWSADRGDAAQLQQQLSAADAVGDRAPLLVIIGIDEPQLGLSDVARDWRKGPIICVGRSPANMELDSFHEYTPWTSAAAAVHRHYQRYWRRRGRVTDLPDDFEQLPDSLKASNYEHARQIREHLGDIGVEVHRLESWQKAPRTPDISDTEVERLARWEHERWCANRRAAGFRPGVRSLSDKTSPYLKPFEELPADVQRYNIDVVREWPCILAEMGYELRRAGEPDDLDSQLVVEQLARAFHDNYVAERRREGETAETNSALRPYDDLEVGDQNANRDAARAVPRKLALIGYELVSAEPGDTASPIELSDEQVEILAEAEHTRWAWQKRLAGWIHGDVKDSDAKTHPDLVPYAELSEASKDRDREQVRLLPALVAKAGYALRRSKERTADATSGQD